MVIMQPLHLLEKLLDMDHRLACWSVVGHDLMVNQDRNAGRACQSAVDRAQHEKQSGDSGANQQKFGRWESETLHAERFPFYRCSLCGREHDQKGCLAPCLPTRRKLGLSRVSLVVAEGCGLFRPGRNLPFP